MSEIFNRAKKPLGIMLVTYVLHNLYLHNAIVSIQRGVPSFFVFLNWSCVGVSLVSAAILALYLMLKGYRMFTGWSIKQ